MKFLLTFLILCLRIYGWSDHPPRQSFFIEASISSDSVAIDQLITLKITLHYPLDYHPNIDLLKRRLLSYGGFNEPPFTLSQQTLHPPQKSGESITQQLDFILSPQLSGKHFLSPHIVQFDSSKKEGKPIEIPSEVFIINVFIPQIAFNPQSVIEPPMPLSQELPISLSQENRRRYLKNPLLVDAEIEKNKSFLKHKSFPWLSVIAGVAVLLVIALARLLPSNVIENKIEIATKEKNEAEIKKQLKETIENPPKDTNEAVIYSSNLDFLVRKYLANTYDLPAFSLTVPELLTEINTLKDLPKEIQDGILQILTLADKIKFASYNPTSEDCQAMPKTTSGLLTLINNKNKF